MRTNAGPAEELARAAEPVVSGLGFELVEAQVARAGRRRILRVLADRPGGGISLGDCERISRALAAALDGTRLVEGSYTLEVSSPGLDRRLTRPADFRRYRGTPVVLQMADGRRVEGELTEAGEDFVKLGDGPAIPLSQVSYGTRKY